MIKFSGPADRIVKNSKRKSGKGTKKVTDKVTEKVTDKATNKASDKATYVTDKSIDKTTDKASNKVTNKVTEKVTEKVTDKVTDKVTNRERQILRLLIENPDDTTSQLAARLAVTRKTVARYLKSLKEKGVIERVGSDRKGCWEIKFRQ